MDVRTLLIWCAVFLMNPSGLAFSEEITREEAAQLMEECQRQREENIAPMREQAIEDCVTNRGRDRDYCERFNRTFGNAKRNANGTMSPGLFWDLPICKKADSADRFFRANPGRQTYTATVEPAPE